MPIALRTTVPLWEFSDLHFYTLVPEGRLALRITSLQRYSSQIKLSILQMEERPPRTAGLILNARKPQSTRVSAPSHSLLMNIAATEARNGKPARSVDTIIRTALITTCVWMLHSSRPIRFYVKLYLHTRVGSENPCSKAPAPIVAFLHPGPLKR